ncbi:MAG: hypothetical protein ACOX6P_06735 [Candidatus Merdivicinus sp.]|jgi:hypothetical protein
MANFNITVTNAGRTLLASSIGGQAVSFTRFQLGDGLYDGDPKGVEALVSPKFSLNAASVSREENYVTIRANLTMQQIEQPFVWREIGLFARIADGSEVLAVYGNAGSQGDYLSKQTGILDERDIVLSILIQPDEVVTDFTGVLFASAKDLADHIADTACHPLPQQKVYALSHAKSGTIHQLTGLSGVSGTVSAAFKATAEYKSGDTFTVDGTPYTIQLSNGETAEDNLFVSGAAVAIVLDTGEKKVNFKAAGGAKLPADAIALVDIFVSNTTWTVPVTAKYRITCIGKGGNGGNSQGGGPYAGGGGASGGWCRSLMSLTKGEQYSITCDTAQSSFGSMLTATAGQDGANGKTGEMRISTGGTASGGTEVNYNGVDTQINSGSSGGVAGAAISNASESKFLVEAPGNAGARIANDSYGSDGNTPLSANQKFSPFGNGAGGAGTGPSGTTVGGKAPSGAVIVELVLN